MPGRFGLRPTLPASPRRTSKLASRKRCHKRGPSNRDTLLQSRDKLILNPYGNFQYINLCFKAAGQGKSHVLRKCKGCAYQLHQSCEVAVQTCSVDFQAPLLQPAPCLRNSNPLQAASFAGEDCCSVYDAPTLSLSYILKRC